MINRINTMMAFLILSFGNFNINAKGIPNNDSIRFNIEKDTVFLPQGSELQIQSSIFNNTGKTLIFYAFKYVDEGVGGLESYCDGDNTAGNAIIIERDGRQVFPAIGFEYIAGAKPVTKEDVIACHLSGMQKFKDTKAVVQPHSLQKFELALNLKKYRFSSGHYDLYLVYYSGKNLGNMVDIETQMADEQKYSGKVFSGYAISNKIKLIVE